MLGDSLRRRRPRGRDLPPLDDAPARSGAGTRRGWPGLRGDLAGLSWIGWLATAVLVLGGSFVVGYFLATLLIFPRPETAGTGIPVPALYGMDVQDAERALIGVGLQVGPITELASVRTRAGRVLAQDPVPEQQLRPGAAVGLAVSSGPPEARVPPLTGLGAIAARDLLETAGFEVQVQHVRTGAVPADAVVRTEPEAGSMVRLPAAVTMVVSAGPADPDPPDPDAAPDARPGAVPGAAPDAPAGAGPSAAAAVSPWP